MKYPLFLILLLGATALRLHAASEAETLCSLGAVGDGKTDDRAAIEAALKAANGNIVDGEGKVYAVRGNIETSGVPIHFRNATLVQIMERLDVSNYIPSAKGNSTISVEPPEALVKTVNGLPYLSGGTGTYAEDPVLSGNDLEKVQAYTGLRTLALGGAEEKPVPVRLEKIKIVRGQYADAGSMPDASGLLVEHASPLSLDEVEITGDGKGTGVRIRNCKDVNIHKLNVHDMRWAPYLGDVVLPLASVKNDFGWNNFPIYVYRGGPQPRFVRVRINEQMAGMHMRECENVVITDSQVADLGTLIEGKPYAIQADGITVNRVKNLLIKNCNVSFVWEGIDFTGGAGQDFVFENIRTQDCFSYGIKIAHPKQNGKIVDCIVERSGNVGFSIEPGAENMEFTNCQALETGSSGNWGGGNGFRISGGDNPDEGLPRQIRFIRCAAINKKYPGKMIHGFACAPEAGKPEFQNTVTKCVVKGAAEEGIVGFNAK